jgi:hypothetical protein
MDPFLVAVIAFAGGSLSAALVGAFARACIFHPVISVRLDQERGSYVTTTVVSSTTTGGRQAQLSLRNTGLSSIKGCSGYITKMTKRVGGRQGVSEEEVLELSWSHKKDADPRDIPPGAFFHMDVVALHLRQTGRVMHLRHFPNSLQNFFTEPGTYTSKHSWLLTTRAPATEFQSDSITAPTPTNFCSDR